jgi:hypothetical protein
MGHHSGCDVQSSEAKGNMSHRALLLLLLCAPAATACFQSLDTSISRGPGDQNSGFPPAEGGPGPVVDAGSGGSSGSSSGSGSSSSGSGSSSGMAGDSGVAGDAGGLPVCQNGNIIDPATSPVYCTDDLPNSGVIVTQTPGIQLPDGTTTMNPCDLMEQESLAIRQTYCSMCHGHPGASAAYHTLLDDNYPTGGPTTADGGPTLFAQTSLQGAKLPDGTPMPLIIPGDHYNSRLYQFVSSGQMPPPVGIMALPKPNISDIALLGAWIDNMPTCFSITSAGGSADAGSGNPDAGGGSPDASAGD